VRKRKNKGHRVKLYIFTAVLFLALSGLGMSYTAWSGALYWESKLETGTMSMIFDRDDSFRVGIAGSDGKIIGDYLSEADIQCQLDADQKQARLRVTEELLLSELARPDRMLVLSYTTSPDTDSVIRKVTPYEADFSAPPDEELEFLAEGVRLTVNGVDYNVSANNPLTLAPTLYWEVYRQMEQDGDTITGTTYLRLSSKSLAELRFNDHLELEVSELPEELQSLVTPLEEGGTEGELLAEVTVNYSFNLPVLVEQSH